MRCTSTWYKVEHIFLKIYAYLTDAQLQAQNNKTNKTMNRSDIETFICYLVI